MDYLHTFAFGIYPYIAIAIFLLGSLIRYDREQYTWKSESTQILHRGSLRYASAMFHVGIIGLFFGHLVGLLTPVWVWDNMGIAHSTKQIVAMAGGGVMGVICLVGLVMLLIRRYSSDRLRRVTNLKDKMVLLWILATLLLGLGSIFVSFDHLDGHTMTSLMRWAQHVVTFRGDASSFIEGAPIVFKLHLVMGMSLFVIFPFTRLVHVWSGFGALSYLGRAFQLVRPR